MTPPIQATNTTFWRAFCRHLWFEFVGGFSPVTPVFPGPHFQIPISVWNVLVWYFLTFHLIRDQKAIKKLIAHLSCLFVFVFSFFGKLYS